MENYKSKSFPFLFAFYILILQGVTSKTLRLKSSYILRQPGDQEADIGDTVSLECVWKSQSASCHWTKDGTTVLLEDSSRYQLPSDNSGNCSLTIHNLQPVDEGTWQCFWDNYSSMDPSPSSREAILSLSNPEYGSPREFIYQPDDNQTVTTGDNVTLKCIFSSVSPHCHWIKDGNVIHISGRYNITGNKRSGDCSITIADVRIFDAGLWQCGYPRTDSEQALRSDRANLSVAVAPSEPVIVVNGITMKNGQKLYLSSMEQQLQLSCWSENGNPASKLEWGIRNHSSYQPLANGRHHIQVYPSTLHASLRIAQLSFPPHYDGQWQQQELVCSASHPTYGNNTHTTSIQLILPYSPPLTTPPTTNPYDDFYNFKRRG